MNPTINLHIEVTAELPLDARPEGARLTADTLTGDVVVEVEVEYHGEEIVDWTIARFGVWKRGGNRYREFVPLPEQSWFDALRVAARSGPWLHEQVADLTAEELEWPRDDPDAREHRLSAAQLGVGMGRAA